MVHRLLHKLGVGLILPPRRYIAVVLIVLVVVASTTYTYTYRHLLRSYETIAMKTVQALSGALDSEELRSLTAEEFDQSVGAYQSIKNTLVETFTQVQEVEKAYFFTVRDGNIYSVVDSLPKDSVESIPPGILYRDAPPEAYQVFIDTPLLATKPHSDRWGRWSSVYSLLPQAEGTIPIAFGLDFDANLFYSVARIRSFGMTVTLIVLLLLALVSYLVIKNSKQLAIEKQKSDEIASSLHTLQLQERQQRKLVETTLQSLGEAVISTDSEGRVVLMNRMAEELTRWSSEEAKGKPLKEIYRIFDGVTQRPCEPSWADSVLETGTPLRYYGYEVQLKRRDDTFVYIEDMIYPILDETTEVTGVVVIFVDVTEKREQQYELEYLSTHDGLTGLLNRQALYAKVESLDLVKHYPMVLMLLDINGLKVINDAYGYAVGDSILTEIAVILQREWHPQQVVGRVDGDEFALFFPNMTEQQAKIVSSEIQRTLVENTFSGYALTISAGFAKKEYMQTSLPELHKQADDDLLRNKIVENQSSRLKMVDLLLQSLFKKSQREMEHSQRVGELAKQFGRYLGYSDGEAEALYTVGVMHDIGKIAVSGTILNKKGKLDAQQWQEIQRHPEIGFNILSSVSQYAPLAEQVLCHHERWDGKGYPNQISGEMIPLYSRILALCDTFDAMTNIRSYRTTVSVEEALDEIARCSNTQFDPYLAKQFIAMIQEKALPAYNSVRS